MSQSTQQEIYKIIAGHAAIEPDTVTPESKLQDLGIDSLEAIEIIFDIEEHFGVNLPDRDPNFDTGSVQGLLDAVQAALAAKAGNAPSAE